MRKALLVLLLLCGAGGWNYHRNLQAEQSQPRPYRGLDQQSLESLAEALEAEVEDLSARYRDATDRPVRVDSDGLLGEKVREFERIQSISRSTRAIGQRLSQSEGSLQRLRGELRQRERESDRVQLHLRRLVGIL